MTTENPNRHGQGSDQGPFGTPGQSPNRSYPQGGYPQQQPHPAPRSPQQPNSYPQQPQRSAGPYGGQPQQQYGQQPNRMPNSPYPAQPYGGQPQQPYQQQQQQQGTPYGYQQQQQQPYPGYPPQGYPQAGYPYPQYQQRMVFLNEDGRPPRHGCMIAMAIVMLIISGLGLLGNLFILSISESSTLPPSMQGAMSEIAQWEIWVSLGLSIMIVVGAILMLNWKKVGFYMTTLAYTVNVGMGFVSTDTSSPMFATGVSTFFLILFSGLIVGMWWLVLNLGGPAKAWDYMD